MKRAVISGVKEVSFIDSPMPVPKEDWVLVKLRSVPLCTEYKRWEQGVPFPGHEAAGEVVATSGYSTKVRVGDRVVVMPSWACGKCEFCRSGDYIHCLNWYDYEGFTGLDTMGDTHAQYIMKQDWLLAPIPDGVSYDVAAMACCGLGPTFGALERFPVNSFDTVLITGAGPVGLGGIINAKYRGAKVISVDAIQYRRKLASDLGADLVLDAMDKDINEKIFEFTQGKGVNVVLETSGTKGGFNTGLNTIKRLGKMAIIGEAKEIVINNVFVNLIQKGITIVGQWHFNMSGIHKMMEMIKNCPSVEKMITHRFPMSQMNEALAVCSSKNCGKVVLDPWK